MTSDLFQPRPETPKRGKKIWATILVAGFLLAAIGLVVSLVLGTFGYDVRRRLLHESRLEYILGERPKLWQVVEGLREKAPLQASPEGDGDLRRAIAGYSDSERAEILKKADRWPELRIFDAGDMMYVIYFDEEEVMRDFVLVDKPGS